MISSRLQELFREFGEGKLTKFAKLCDIPQGTLHGYKSGKIPSSEHLIRIQEHLGISIDWLLTGRGYKYLGKDRQDHPLDPDPEIASLMEGARRVLTSCNHVAFRALEQNIRYFDHAIAAEKRADETEKKITDMEKNFEEAMAAMRTELAELRRENLRFANKAAEAQSSKKKVA